MKTLVAPDSGKILAFLSFGANAGEVMVVVKVAMIAGLPLHRVYKCHSYPSDDVRRSEVPILVTADRE
jgi:hypothetical protein